MHAAEIVVGDIERDGRDVVSRVNRRQPHADAGDCLARLIVLPQVSNILKLAEGQGDLDVRCGRGVPAGVG
jgi:hypothetical protein